MDFQTKIKKLREIIIKQRTTALILKSNDPTFLWLFQKEIEKATLIITMKKIILVTKILEHTDKEFFKQKIIIEKIKNSKELENISKKLRIRSASLNYETATLREIQILNLQKSQDCFKELQELRSQKNKEEIRRIKIACNYVVRCWKEIIKKIEKKEFKTEKQIEKYIRQYALTNGLGLAFEPIVASGRNAGIPHYKPGNKLNKGFLIIDMGFEYDGYKSDMTRTMYLGKPSLSERKTYEELLSVQEIMIKKAKLGMNAQKLYEETIKIMTKPELFIHGLGHGVGIEIHEYPSITEKTEHILKKNQIITIEPGYYTKKYGIRIEDTVLLGTKNQILTEKANKILKIIK